MVIYSQMTDAQIKEYREEQIKKQDERIKQWKKEHPKESLKSTTFDVTHTIHCKY